MKFASMSLRANRYLHWLFGIAALCGVVAVSNHFGELATLLDLFKEARPSWLFVALLLQAGTYLCASLVLRIGAADGNRERPIPAMAGLLRLAIAKQFVSQAMPSIGVSGNLLVVRGLQNRSVSRSQAVFAVLVNLLSHYIAFSVAISSAIIALWWLRDLNPAILIPLTIVLTLMVAISMVVFWLGKSAVRNLPKWIRERVVIGEMDGLFESETIRSAWAPGLILRSAALQLLIFACDGATLYSVLRSLNWMADPFVVIVGFVTASAVAAIALVPGGLGIFEGTCVAILHAHGLSIELALAATLMLRGFTFWLPMIPGLWFSRRELQSRRSTGE